jgi:ATP-dependent exoDNAse (exonuclease V) beta subunit
VDPQFEVLTEPEAERLYGEAFDLWLQQTLDDPPAGVQRSLRRTAHGRGNNGHGPVERLRKAGWTLLVWRDYPEPWRRDPFDCEGLIDELAEAVFAFADLTEACAKKEKDNLYRDTERARRVTRQVRPAEEVRDRDYDRLEAAFVDLAGERNFSRPRKGYGKSFGEGLPREDVLAEHARLLDRLRAFQRAADADLAARLQEDLQEPIARYETLKRRAGRLDFLDLLVRARNLVRDDAGVRAEFQRRFTHLFVDEFQDTDPLQAELLLLLASENPTETNWRRITPRAGKLFLVADPKQSIYRFRRADVGLYLEVRDRLAERGAEVLQLSTSFRSVPAIQAAVNAAFPEFLDGNAEAQQAAYVPLAPAREDSAEQPSVVALPVPSPYGTSGRVANYAVEDSYPDAVGGFVHWLLEKSGWTVTERDGGGERVPVAARHVCLLFRRFDSFFAGDVTRPYVEALEARGVRHLLVGGRSFHDREEVETLRTALAAIEWHDDELSVFATLRGSLFAIGDEELLEYRHRFGRLHPLRARSDLPENLRPVGEALAVLKKLHRPRNRRPIAETVNRLLETTRAHAGFVLRPSGEQALANVLHVAEQARAYEGTGGISFRGFVERLAEDAQGRKAQEAPILEEGSEGVRLMTVHKAKGLEFPVVVLVDPTATLAFENPGRAIADGRRQCALRIAGWSPVELNEAKDREVARDVAEGIRLTYVAATRARDVLVVPVFGDGPHQDVRGDGSPARAGWLSPLSGALYPGLDAWVEPEPVPGAPPFGRDSVVDRPFDPGPGDVGVRPGLYRLEGRTVAWWDPAALTLGVEPSHGVRQAELMSKDADPEVVREDSERYRRWVDAHQESLTRAAAPTENVRTATEWAAVTADEAGEVAVVELPRAKRRPSGARFGALVHAVLATAPLSADAERVRQVVELQGRILGATDRESTAATEVVRSVLAHPLLERARGAEERGECRRETPVAARFGEVLVEGVVDLAFREKGRWVVVDFKTDQEIERELDVYRRQVGLYAAVIGKATGEPSEPVLMRI